MSGFSNSDVDTIFGLQSQNLQHTLPPSPYTLVLLETEEGAPEAGLITRLFRDPLILNGDALRTLVYSVLNAQWFKKKRVAHMPRGTLDPFAQRRGETTVCLFCETSYDNANEGRGCVKAHFGL